MLAGLHDEAARALFVDARHFNEIVRGEFAKIVKRLDAVAHKLAGEIVVHALKAQQRLVGLAQILFTGDGVGEKLVAGALAKLVDRFTAIRAAVSRSKASIA